MPSFDLFSISSAQIKTFDNSISNLIKKLKELKKENPNLSNEEIFDLYKSKNIEFLTHLLTLRPVRSDTFRLNAINTLLDNPYTFQQMYNEVIKDANEGKVDLEDISKLNFTLNSRDCIRTHIIDSIYSSRKEYASYLQELGITPYKASQIDIKAMKKKHNLKQGDDTLEVAKFLKMSEFERIVYRTKEYKASFEKTIKNNYIDTILGYVNHFKEMGYTNNYLSIQHNKFPKELHIEPEDIDNFFTRESLENLSLTKLAALYSFYANRYTKELQALENLNFCLVSGYNLDNFMEAEDPTKVIPEFMKSALIKEQAYISDLSEKLLAINKAEVLAKQNFLNPDTFYSSTFDLRQVVSNEEKRAYMEKFGRKENEFYKMVTGTFELKNHTVNQYYSKDASLLALLSCIQTYPSSIKNWGIILKNDTINPKHDMQLVGFDIKGFNMPLRLHIPTDILSDFAREYLDSKYLPVYEGDKDFTYLGINLPASMLLNQPDRVRKNINEKVSAIDQNKPYSDIDKLFLHMKYIADQTSEDMPNHLKTLVTESKKGKKKQKLKFVKRYVSIKTGEVLNERQFSSLKIK